MLAGTFGVRERLAMSDETMLATVTYRCDLYMIGLTSSGWISECSIVAP
jgi:hypothetical protein